jgi:hypothetical protein
MINIVFGGIMIGKTPHRTRSWAVSFPSASPRSAAGPSPSCWHQSSDFPTRPARSSRCPFAGGHGTIAGMGGLLTMPGLASWSTSGWDWPL